MTTYKKYMPDPYNNRDKNMTVYQSLKTDIVKVSTAEDFPPAVNINANTKEIKNLVTDYSDDSSAVNVGFLTNKVQEVVVDVNDKIVNVKKNVVFKNES